MKKLIPSLLVIILMAAGCASTSKNFNIQATPGVDFKNYKTYAFLRADDTSYAKMVNKQLFVESLAKAGVDQLTKRGMTKDSIHPDCYFKYSLVMSRKYAASQQSEMVYNPGVVTPAFDNQAQIYYFSSDNRPVVYNGKMGVTTMREGTLVIYMIDSKSMNVIWQSGYTNSRNEENLPDLQNAVGFIVPEMFKKFPVK